MRLTMQPILKLLAPLLLTPLVSLQAADVVNLRCEYLKDPLGIDVAKPRLSWVIDAPQSQITRSVRQTAYQVLVASTPELLAMNKGDLWDSGKVESDQSIQVEYAGKPPESRMKSKASAVEPAPWLRSEKLVQDLSTDWSVSFQLGKTNLTEPMPAPLDTFT